MTVFLALSSQLFILQLFSCIDFINYKRAHLLLQKPQYLLFYNFVRPILSRLTEPNKESKISKTCR